jgi:hypothetical protein
MNAETAVHFAAGAVVLMALMLAAVAVMIVLDTIAVWPPRHRRTSVHATAGVQYGARSTQATTAAVAIAERRWSR